MISVKIKGAQQFAHNLKQFARKDKERIIRSAFRSSLLPHKKHLSAATPRSSGVRHKHIQQRKAEMGWPTTPAHAADAISVSIRVNRRRGELVGKLEHKKGFQWYIRILAVGFVSRGGRTVIANPALTRVILRAQADGITLMPAKISASIERTLSARLKKTKS